MKSGSTPAATSSLRQTCPKVGASLPSAMRPFSVWQQFADRLDHLAVAGDAQTKSALEPFQSAVAELAAQPAAGQKALAAGQRFIQELDHLTQRCAAVGSTALQPKS